MMGVRPGSLESGGIKKAISLAVLGLFLLTGPIRLISHVCATEKPELEKISALELTLRLGNGINLGNTMESYGRRGLGIKAHPSQYETFWGQPLTSPELISGMKEAGFDSLRIPVAWTNTMDYENEDYTIAPAYLKRVEEIVNYALDSQMFVIINAHWDGGWWGMFGSSDEETRGKAFALFEAMWTQIGLHFRDYPLELIFEAANEELGTRLNETGIARDSGYLSEDQTYQITNEINRRFVRLIRSLGGANSQRFLLIPGYDTDIEKTLDARFEMPLDSVPDKLLISVHYYTPWNYCGIESVNDWGTEQEYAIQNELLSKMKKFTELGYGVVFGEYGVLPKEDGSLKNNTLDFLSNFHDKMELYGYAPILWDPGIFFGREKLEMFHPELAEFFQERSLKTRSLLREEKIEEK